MRGGHWSGDEISLTRENSFGRPRQYFSEWDIHIQPAWLRNGSELLVISNRNVALGSGDLWRIPNERDAMAHGKKILQEQTLYQTRPDVAPDGKRIVYASTAGASDQFNHLYALPIEGGRPYKLTFGDHDDFHPRWSPDGESIAYISNEEGLPQLYLLETNGGGKRKIEIRRRHWKQPMSVVRVSVMDEKTGKPSAVRISGAASDGKLYAPVGAYVFNARLASGLKRVFYTNGSFAIEIPAGKLVIEVTKGFEYFPIREELDIRPGETREVRLTLRQKTDMAAQGWYNGSTHVHMNYGGIIHNTPESLLLMARAQGMHIVSALVANKDNRILDWQYFEKGGKPHPASDLAARLLLLFGEENRPPFWGTPFISACATT